MFSFLTFFSGSPLPRAEVLNVSGHLIRALITFFYPLKANPPEITINPELRIRGVEQRSPKGCACTPRVCYVIHGGTKKAILELAFLYSLNNFNKTKMNIIGK